ncbi:MAG: hypothetical protein ACYCUE_05220, partial [Steroidobacteraceae bacterium]
MHDRQHGTLRILAEPEAAVSLERIAAEAQRLAEIARGASREPALAEAIEEEPAAQYLARVRRAQHYIGTSTEASDPAGMSHLRNVRARQPRRRCVRSEAGRPAPHVRVV